MDTDYQGDHDCHCHWHDSVPGLIPADTRSRQGPFSHVRLFCFLTIWGITDAVVHTAAMDYAQYAFEEMRQSSLGVYSMAAFPSLSEKMLSMFGIIRSSGIMLASLFTMMLIKFGGHALAMMAGSLSGAVNGAGGAAGALMTPEGTSAAAEPATTKHQGIWKVCRNIGFPTWPRQSFQ